MNKTIFALPGLWLGLCLALCSLFSLPQAQAQTSVGGKTAVGRWKTIDDETNKPRSIVEIYKQGDKYYGKVIEIFREPSEDQNPKCTKCSSSDSRYNQPIIGMVIVRNMVDRSSKYADGDILDPKKGSIYSCTMWLDSGDVLKVRGWWGFVYRTQTWYRVQ